MMIPANIIDLLPTDSITVIQYALNNHRYVIPPPRGNRNLADSASLITSCVRRMQQAASECPTDTDYQDAKVAEKQAEIQYQQLKNNPDTRLRLAAKKDYETAKEHRVQVGGAIIGAEAVIRRMSALIAGEIEMVELREVHKKSA